MKKMPVATIVDVHGHSSKYLPADIGSTVFSTGTPLAATT